MTDLVEPIEAALRPACQFDPDCPQRLAEAIRYALLAPGKRLRPALVLMAAEACGGTIEEAMPGAVAVEMVHAYSLIHDDLPAMDDDDLRRGRPTVHIQFDEATAILAGDALLTQAFSHLSRARSRIPGGRLRRSRCSPSAAGADPAGRWPSGRFGGRRRETRTNIRTRAGRTVRRTWHEFSCSNRFTVERPGP